MFSLRKHNWRVFVFLLFLAGFFVAAPAVVLYTAGYRFDFGHNRIVKTGVLSVTSYPKHANIILDGKQVTEQTPLVLNNVLPGERTVEFTKSGYTSWKKTANIKSNETSFLSTALLFFKDEIAKISDMDAVVFAVSEQGYLAYLLKNNSFIELWMRTNDDKEILLASMPASAQSGIQLDWSPDGKRIFLAQEGKFSGRVISTETKNLIEFSLKDTMRFQWDIQNPALAFLQKNNGALEQIDLRTNKTTRVPGLVDSAFAFQDGWVGVQSSGAQDVLSIIGADGVAEITSYLPHGEYNFVRASSDLIMLKDTQRDGRIVLINPKEQQPILMNATAKMWDWNADGTKIVFSDGTSIEVYDTVLHTRQTLTRTSEPVLNVAWEPHADVIFFATPTRVVAQEFDLSGEQNQITLVSMDTEAFWMDEKGEMLYVFGAQNNTRGLYKRRLQK